MPEGLEASDALQEAMEGLRRVMDAARVVEGLKTPPKISCALPGPACKGCFLEGCHRRVYEAD
jgi:hypothetical protein